MVTADEIRARVKAADEARIANRADRAATVADVYSRRAEVLAELERIETQLTASVRSATEVMTFDELVTFVDVPRAGLGSKRAGTAASVKARSPKTRRRSTTPKAATPTTGGPASAASA